MRDSTVGKKAEQKIKQWLDRPEDGYSFDRLPDQMTGFYGSSNICDFICYKYPDMYYIESKATYEDRFDFSMLTDTQYKGLLNKSKIDHVYGVVIVLFVSYKRTFLFDINQIDLLRQKNKKSLNIKKINSWNIKYSEIQTIPNGRKSLLDYTGDLQQYCYQAVVLT